MGTFPPPRRPRRAIPLDPPRRRQRRPACRARPAKLDRAPLGGVARVTELKDLTRCAIHTMTTKPWSLAECIAGYSRLGILGISVWTDAIEKIGAPEAGRMLRDAGMHVPALVRGGFFFSAGAI